MKISLAAITLLFLLASCHQQSPLKVVLTRFPNDSIQEVIYFNVPVTKDSVGVKEIYYENGNLHAKGSYKNGKREGKWTCYTLDGKLEWRAEYTQGLENGLTECFMENGSWRKMNIINGCKQGVTTEYNLDSTGGESWVYGQYKNCKEDGEWIWKNKQGRVVTRQCYAQGKPDKYYENYYSNGVVYNKAFLRNGYIDSLETFDSLGRLLDTKYYHEATFN
jgi:antitoxin component YwqK of YwqJK toxin-antitoxin module